MMPALRGENGLPGNFSGFYDETADVLAAAQVLRGQPGVDPARLFLAGHSVGGTLTLLAAMSTRMFRAAASFSGNPDARAFFRRFPEDIRFDAADALEFDMRSAACFARKLQMPHAAASRQRRKRLGRGHPSHGRAVASRRAQRAARRDRWRSQLRHPRGKRRKPPLLRQRLSVGDRSAGPLDWCRDFEVRMILISRS